MYFDTNNYVYYAKPTRQIYYNYIVFDPSGY